MFIKPTVKASGSIFDVHENAADILLYTANEDVSCPWDADIRVQEGEVILEGTCTGSGSPSTSGYCLCKVDLAQFSDFYKLEVPDDDEELIAALEAAGWERA